MEELYSLVQCLTGREWESLQQYLAVFSTHGADPFGPKQLQLARLLKEEETCPAETRCSLLIYGVKDEPCFQMLKSRLKEKTLDFLLTDISCDKKQELDEADYAIVKMKKKSAQFQQLYHSKKRIPLLYGLLDEIINLSKEYEHYPILIDHLKHKKNLVSWKNGKQEYDSVNKKMEYAVNCNALLIKAENYYFDLVLQSEYAGKYDKRKTLAWLKDSISEIDEENKEFKSPIISYYHKLLEMDYYQLQENYLKSRSVCLELLKIVRDNKSVMRRQRIGEVYGNLSRCEYYLVHYKQAIDWASESQKHFNPNSENYCISLEQEFYALFAMERYEDAITMAERMISSATRKELGEFRDAKYHYLLANALFKKERFREALNLLSQERELAKDKAGWETGRRTLQIMTLIEMNQLDEAGLAVHSLKQFFKRADKKTPVSPRDKIILKLLQMAERKEFIFNTFHGSVDKYMDALQVTSYELRVTKDKEATRNSSFDTRNLQWEPFTHEVIPFHEWFAGKMKIHLRKVGVRSEKQKVMVMK